MQQHNALGLLPRLSVLLSAGLIALGCHSDDTVSPYDPSASAFWAVQLNHQGITMAVVDPYDTLTLVARPVTSAGNAIEGLPPVSFTTTNVNTVTVSPEGRITAVGVTPGTLVIATLTANGITHADTATVAVTEDPAGLIVASFSMEPVFPDSARFALGGTLLEPFHNINPTILDPNGDPLSGIPVRFRSLDVTTALVDPWGGTVTGQRMGYLDIEGAITAYGQTFKDTLHFRIGRPGYAKAKIHGPFYAYVPYVTGSILPDSIVVATGAVIEFESTGMLQGQMMDITMDEAGAAATLDAVPEQYVCVNYEVDCDAVGNISAFGWPVDDPDNPDFEAYFRNVSRARRFTVPGVYHYTNTEWGTHGVIVVVDETAP